MTVYTETVVHQKGDPYQVAIVTRDDGSRVTGRVEGERVVIGDVVEEIEPRDGVPWFRRM